MEQLQNQIYFIATPIGNLEEITLRAIKILKKVDYIFCEHVGKAKILANKFTFNKPFFILNKNNEASSFLKIQNFYQLKKNIAIISDAGYPCISDPGLYIMNQLIKNNIEPVIINGPCSLIHAVCQSGFNNSQFTFCGFLKSKNNFLTKTKELSLYLPIKHSLIFFESSNRLLHTLKAIAFVFDETIKITIAKELTKKYEQFVRDDVKNMITNFATFNFLKGEYIIIIDNHQRVIAKAVNNQKIFLFFNYLQKNFSLLSNKDKIKLTSKFFNINNHKIYTLYHQWQKT